MKQTTLNPSTSKVRRASSPLLLLVALGILYEARRSTVHALDLADNLVVAPNDAAADSLVNSWLAVQQQHQDSSNDLLAYSGGGGGSQDEQDDDFVSQDEEQFILSNAGQRDLVDALGLESLELGRRNEIYLLEDKDYPKSLFEDYSRRIGQVSGLSALPSDDLIVFHRAERQWNATTNDQLLHFAAATDKKNQSSPAARQAQGNEHLIANDTLMIIDRDDGSALASFGANLFYMPHSCTSDRAGNIWLSDVGRHQVMRLPSSALFGATGSLQHKPQGLAHRLRKIWPDVVLGEAFVSGADEHHFCQPSEIEVSSDGRLVYVADGYCNQRVMVFTGEGRFVRSFGEAQQMSVVHSLTLIEERNLLCVADRENARILCYSAGLDPAAAPLDSLGQLEVLVKYPIGRVYAIQAISADHLLVSSKQFTSQRYDLAILNPFTQELKLVWTSSDLLEPHSLARTFDGQYAYAADVSHDAAKKVFKFEIIQRTS